MKLSLTDAAAIMGTTAPRSPEAAVTGYSIDSRTIQPGEMFFAIRGAARDGHEFVAAALAAGATAAVVEQPAAENDPRLLVVADTRVALRQLAKAARRKWGGRVAAVTGSNGKTTTKEILAALLATRFRVAKSEGNLNNDLGLPLSLLRMADNTEIAVMEMGMNHAGEIRLLAEIAGPQIGIVTNVTPVHLEFFASVDEIALAKRELIEGLTENGTAVLNADDERVRSFARVHRGRSVSFGVECPADVRAVDVEDLGPQGTRFRLAGSGTVIGTPLVGRHNLYNTLAGLAGARACGVELELLVEAVAQLKPAPMRGQLLESRGIRIINDCYNSNPRAAEMMLDVLAAMPARRRVAVLGEMLELGASSEALHRQVGSKAARVELSLLAGVRGGARYLVEAAVEAGFPRSAARFFEDSRGAGEFLSTALEPGDAVLLKGSRAVRLEQALEAILGRGGDCAPC